MAINRTSNRVIEGDDIEAQIVALPELMYQTRTNPNNPAIWETYNPKTGEIVDTGVFAGGGDQGLLAASRPVLALAASVLGAPYLSNLIAGSTGLTGSALAGATGATIAGGSTALTGGSAEDTLRAALLGGGGAYAGSALNNYLDTGTTDIGITERQFAIQDARQLADQGLTTSQIRDTLSSGGYNDAIIDRALTAITPTPTATAISTPITDANAVNITAPSNVSLNNVLSTIGSTIPTVTVAAPKTQVDPPILDLVNSQLVSNVTTPANLPTVNVTGDKATTSTTDSIINTILGLPPVTTPVTPTVTVTDTKTPTIADIISSIVTPPVVTLPVTTPTTPTVTVEAPKDPEVLPPIVTPPVTPPTITDIVKVISVIPIIDAIVNPPTTPTPTTFPIVPVPEGWKTPPPTGVAPFTSLPPIDFGTRNLLMGTQWEKFLDPNYGKVPEPVKYSQPSNMSYNDLMSILGSKQGMPSRSSLSINDIISGIQNQYGQTPTRTMG